eukprot:5827557-Pyramimonas_sp.AAC.1
MKLCNRMLNGYRPPHCMDVPGDSLTAQGGTPRTSAWLRSVWTRPWRRNDFECAAAAVAAPKLPRPVVISLYPARTVLRHRRAMS